MHGSVTVLAGAVLGALGIGFGPFFVLPADGPSLPQMIRLDPQPFAHRLDGDWQRDGFPTDAPVASVTIPAPVEIMSVPVSTRAWMTCVEAGACLPPDAPVDRPELPVTGVSWLDASAYAQWLSRETGQVWRLPSDVEWAYAAAELYRDDAIGTARDLGNPAVLWLATYAVESARKRDLDREIRPVGSQNVNSRGMYDIAGAVWGWTSTCLRRVDIDSAGGILSQSESCGIYIAEGLHRAAIANFVRNPRSGGCSVGLPPANMGFRLVRDPDAVFVAGLW